MSWQAASWALTRAPMPKSDPSARAVLAYLGVKADGKGRNAYPLALSIAHDCGLNPEVVPRVLKRLVDYGLISKDGVGPQGQPRWTLHMDRCHSDESFEEFVRRHQGGRALRQSRWRTKPDVDDDGSSTRDDDESSTSDLVDDDRSSTEGYVDDDGSSRRRLSIVSETTMSRNVDDSKYPQISPLDQSRSVLDQSPSDAAAPDATELALGIDAAPKATAPQPTKAGYTEAFEAAWIAYERKGAKKAAFAEWQRALKRADVATITAAIPAYVRSTPEIRFRKDFERWLKGDCWESAVVPARQVVNGHHPYQDPDIDDYYEDM